MDNKSLEMLDIYLFLDHTVEEGSFNIHLMQSPSHSLRNNNNSLDESVSSHVRKCLITINSLFMRESSSHKYCLIFFNTSISCMFDLENPLGSYYILLFLFRDHFPHIVFHDGFVFFHYGIIPYLILRNFPIGGGF